MIDDFFEVYVISDRDRIIHAGRRVVNDSKGINRVNNLLRKLRFEHPYAHVTIDSTGLTLDESITRLRALQWRAGLIKRTAKNRARIIPRRGDLASEASANGPCEIRWNPETGSLEVKKD